jgi:TRAP-type C4-dicarboxylate transport system permease small subunit
MMPVPDGIDYLPLVIAGVLIVLFSIEHIIALLRGQVVEPAWN